MDKIDCVLLVRKGIDLCFSSFFYIIYKILYKILNMESKDYVKNRYFKDNDRIYILLGVN